VTEPAVELCDHAEPDVLDVAEARPPADTDASLSRAGGEAVRPLDVSQIVNLLE
jgi:hypothetical protein